MGEENRTSVSVIIPIYNSAEYLKECLDSVLQQTFAPEQIILVDDGSTDESGSICDEYAKDRTDIVVIHKENGGQSSARNRGIDVAESKYIYFLDSDDYLLENALESLVTVAENTDADAVFFEADSFFDVEEDSTKAESFVYSRGRLYEPSGGVTQLKNLADHNEYYVCVPLHLYKRSYLNECGIRFREGIVHEDDLFSAEVYLNNGIIAHCHDTLYMMRIRENSTMTNRSDEWLNYRYKSYLTVYYHLSDLLNKKCKDREVTAYYAANTTYAVINNYHSLSSKFKRMNFIRQFAFRRHALFRYGKYDFDVACNCSGPVLRFFLKAIRRIKRG